jgi:hypothetical protein
MSGKKNEKFYEEDEDEEEEDKKCPPNRRVSRSNPNEVHKQSDAPLLYEEELEDTKCRPQQLHQSKVNEERGDHKPAKHHVHKHHKHAHSRSNPNEVHKQSDVPLLYEEEMEDNKCPPQQFPWSKGNEDKGDHKPTKHHVRNHHKHVHKHHNHTHTKEPTMESSSHKKANATFAQKDEEYIAMEAGVLSEEWDKVKEGTNGHVPGSDPNEWGMSNEAGKAAHGSSGGRHAVSSLRGTDASPGAEAVDSRAHPPNNARRRTYNFPPTRPGAERVPGPGNEGLDDDDDDDEEQMTIVSPEESIIPIVPEAERVDIEEEERRRQKEINQGIDDFIATAAVADVVPDNRGKRRKLMGAFLLVIVIVIGTVLGITLRPETVSPVGYSVLLSSVSSDEGEALRNSSTPQYMAFNWMATNDTLLRPDEQIIQRYALATLFYSTNGDKWTENEFWLGDGNECEWEKVSCTTKVSRLDLMSNNLQGTLPPEIGLLSKLGEFIMEQICRDALEHSLSASIRVRLFILMVCLDCLCSISTSSEQYTHWYDAI